jgi:uncharacterized protein YycO
MRAFLLGVSVLLLGFSAACSAPSVMVKKPQNNEANQAVTEMWARDIKRVAKSGDWILTRSYSLVGDAITVASIGEEVSHAVIYDAERGTIIEAITPTVREVPLENLLERNRLAIVIRPSRLSEDERRASVDRARSKVGARFDFGGLLGVQSEARFYCSELVLWASDLRAHGVRKPVVITPAALASHGEVIYLSGHRDDAQLQNAAVASRRLRTMRARERSASRAGDHAAKIAATSERSR